METKQEEQKIVDKNVINNAKKMTLKKKAKNSHFSTVPRGLQTRE